MAVSHPAVASRVAGRVDSAQTLRFVKSGDSEIPVPLFLGSTHIDLAVSHPAVVSRVAVRVDSAQNLRFVKSKDVESPCFFPGNTHIDLLFHIRGQCDSSS